MGQTLTSKLRGYGKEAIHRVRKWAMFHNLENRMPTFVYQMGKVGSSTVVRTLEGMNVSTPVIHIHTLNPQKVSAKVEALRSNPGYLHEHVVTSRTLVNKRLDWGRFPCRIITLTREPVGRAISFAFQDWKRQLPDVSGPNELDPERMIELVREKLQPGSFHANPGQWFERELRAIFNIDAMAIPYNFEQGYVMLRSGPVDVLMIRMEDLDRSLEAGLADLYGQDTQGIEMRRSNVGENKKYADLLAEVKERLAIPPSMSERIWSTDYAEHFYGPDIHRLRKKWEVSA